MIIKLNKNITAAISYCQKLKSRVRFVQLKPILDIFLQGFCLSSYSQQSLKVLLLYSLLLTWTTGREGRESPTVLGPLERANLNHWIQSKSKSHCDWRSVSQYVLVSSPVWDFWPEIFFFKVTVLSFGGALSDERSGLSCVSLCHWSLP
jgi:hypothetical protein